MKNMGQRIEEPPDGNNTYHFEYTNIHNQRMALVRIMHLWHQIGFPAAYAIFGFFFNFGFSKEKWPFIIIGASISSLAIYLVRKFAIERDRSVIRLYPRILTLELILNYYFYRNYLRGKGGASKIFVEKCEGMTAKNPDELQCKVGCEFRDEFFPSNQRGHGLLNKGAWIIVGSFWAITVFSVAWVLLYKNSGA